MAKTLFKINVECIQSNKNKNGCQLLFANQVKPNADGKTATAREGISFNVADTKVSAALDPGKKYTITITEE